MIKVFNCGHDSHHKKPCDIFHPAGLSDYLFLLVKHEAWVYINNVKCTITPDSVLLFPPGTPIHYGCDTTDYNDDWIHFDLFDTDADLMKTFAFSYGVILQPHDFSCLTTQKSSPANFTQTESTENPLSTGLCTYFYVHWTRSLKKRLVILPSHSHLKNIIKTLSESAHRYTIHLLLNGQPTSLQLHYA